MNTLQPSFVVINKLGEVLNFALSVGCKNEAACIRKCINEIDQLQKRYIPTVQFTYVSEDNINKDEIENIKHIPIISDWNWYHPSMKPPEQK